MSIKFRIMEYKARCMLQLIRSFWYKFGCLHTMIWCSGLKQVQVRCQGVEVMLVNSDWQKSFNVPELQQVS